MKKCCTLTFRLFHCYNREVSFLEALVLFKDKSDLGTNLINFHISTVHVHLPGLASKQLIQKEVNVTCYFDIFYYRGFILQLNKEKWFHFCILLIITYFGTSQQCMHVSWQYNYWLSTWNFWRVENTKLKENETNIQVTTFKTEISVEKKHFESIKGALAIHSRVKVILENLIFSLYKESNFYLLLSFLG